MTQQWECWAYVSPEGKLTVLPEALNEMNVWCWMFGDASTKDNIQAAKQRGAKVVRVRIEEICDGD